MRNLLTLLLDALRHFFRWRAQATDPAQQYRKVHDAWKVELERLDNEWEKARNVWRNAVAAGRDSIELFILWSKAGEARNNHCAREPKREDY